MKKRSKIFLIVSAIIIVIGLVLIFFGVKTAETTGEQIDAAKVGEDRVYTYSFGKVDKIKIDVTDADINVYGKSESSYVEVINFNENLSNYSANNAIVTFRETTEIKDIAGLWESGISFKGLRYLLRPVSSDKQKTVNIYLSEEESVKALDIDLQRGTVTVENVKTLSDYHVTIESGKVNFTDVTTDSGIDIVASGEISTDVNFTRVTSEDVSVNAKKAKFNAESFTSDLCELNVSMGSSTIEYTPKNPEYTIEIASKGKLVVDGQLYIDSFVYPPVEEEEPVPEEPEEPEEPEDSEGEEDVPEPSALRIISDDFSVDLTTPEGIVADDTTSPSEDTTAVQQ